MEPNDKNHAKPTQETKPGAIIPPAKPQSIPVKVAALPEPAPSQHPCPTLGLIKAQAEAAPAAIPKPKEARK